MGSCKFCLVAVAVAIAGCSQRAAEPAVRSEGRVVVGRVVGVHDGDTITVLEEKSTEQKGRKGTKVRLAGIDAPERKQSYGTQSKEALSRKVMGRQVRVEWRKRGRWRRIIGEVYVDDRWINLEMVADGAAWHWPKYSKSKKLADAQAKAKRAKAGLWADGDAIAPWEFRR